MDELTTEQARVIEQHVEGPPLIVDPRTQEAFVLVRKDDHDKMQKWFAPLKRRWVNPADDDRTTKDP